VITTIVEHLKEQKILNDQKLVEETVEWSIRAKGYGRRRILAELKRRGIKETQVEKVLDRYSKEEEREIAEKLAQNRWSRLEKLEPQKRMKRLYDFLINRGFEFELAREVVQQTEHERENI